MQRNIIRKKLVQKKTGLSDTTIWRHERAGEFPTRLQITEGGAVGWYEDEVDRWINNRERGFGKLPRRAGRGEAA